MSSLRRDLVNLDEPVDDVAAGWFALQRSGRMGQGDEQALAAWLAADPVHRMAFQEVQATWAELEVARAHPDVLSLREQARRHLRARRPKRRPWVGGSIAAGLALAAVAGGWALTTLAPRAGFTPFERPIEHQFRTSVGQRTTMTLPDGSVVTLDTDTVLRTWESRRERRVALERGQAFFQVAKDHSRPFVVVAGEKTVTATGTAFDVRLDPGRFVLTMAEGRVRVEAPLDGGGVGGRTRYIQTTDMVAGRQLVALADQQWTIRRIDPERETAWVHGQLIYDAAPLSEVAAEMNRYSDKKIVIADPRLARRPVNGTFRAGDVDGFVKALRSYGLVRVAGDSDIAVELASR